MTRWPPTPRTRLIDHSPLVSKRVEDRGCDALCRSAARRWVTARREGGSLPALMEADDLGTYVVKFRGARQGRAALIAEVIAAGIAERLGLPIPDLVLVEVDAALAPPEPDEEIQDLLRASVGLNLGVDFLPGRWTSPTHRPLWTRSWPGGCCGSTP